MSIDITLSYAPVEDAFSPATLVKDFIPPVPEAPEATLLSKYQIFSPLL